MDLNPYEELGVHRDASDAHIRSAYRAQAKVCHPDVEGGSREDFERIGTALAVLSDPKKRRTYDETGRIEEDRPDNDRANALQIVEQHVAAIVNAFASSGFDDSKDPRKFDMPREIVRLIRAEMDDAAAGILGGNHHVAFLRDMSKRFTLKNPSASLDGDPISRGFRIQAERAEQQIEDLKSGIRVREIAVKIAEGYDFRQDAPAPRSTTTFGSFRIAEYDAGAAAESFRLDIGR